MHNYLVSLFLFFTIISSIKAQETKPPMDTVSYSVGVLIAQNLKSQGFEKVEINDVVSAISDVLEGRTPKIDPQTANANIKNHVSEKQAAKFAAVKSEGTKFLADNKLRSEVTTTASGLQYQVLKTGMGIKPTTASKVTVHYEGSLIDGTIFDSSLKRQEPTSFGVTQVIKGWTEGLQLMPLGSKYRFYIPFDLAYGQRGAPPSIPPFATLIFEVELLEIN